MASPIIYIRYGCLIRKYFSHGKYKGWRVGVDMKNSKTFLFQNYKTQDACYMDALAHKQFLSDSHGQTEIIEPAPLSDAERSYFAGFMDADGSFLISPNNKRPNHGQIIISAGQVCSENTPQVLQRLLKTYGGNIYTVNMSKHSPKAFRVWKSTTSFPLLMICYDVAKYGLLKAAQAQMILDHVQQNDTTNGHALHGSLMAMHHEEDVKEVFDTTRVNFPWCAGIFDGNGSLTWNTLEFTKLPLCILKAINALFDNSGFIAAAQRKLVFSDKNRAAVIKALRPFWIRGEELISQVSKEDGSGYDRKCADPSEAVSRGCHETGDGPSEMDLEGSNEARD
jgi:hypothetical protein